MLRAHREEVGWGWFPRGSMENAPLLPTRTAGVHKLDKTILVLGFFQES